MIASLPRCRSALASSPRLEPPSRTWLATSTSERGCPSSNPTRSRASSLLARSSSGLPDAAANNRSQVAGSPIRRTTTVSSRRLRRSPTGRCEVTSSRSPGQCSISAVRKPRSVAPWPWSKFSALSRIHSARRSPMARAMRQSGASGSASPTQSAARARRCSTERTSSRATQSTWSTPTAGSPLTCSAAARATSVLPMPGMPRTVTSRWARSFARISATSRGRSTQ
jgi:hypothetical protein